MKRVAMIIEFNGCYKCPYRTGGKNLGSQMYCGFFGPPEIIMNSNGKLLVEVDWYGNNFIPKFCKLPDDEVFNGVI